MSTNTTRTIGIIRLADEHYRPELEAEQQDLASTLKWLVADTEAAKKAPVSTRQRFCADTVECLRPANSVLVSADLDVIYSQLEDELQRLTAC